jgi:hypothetical protein
VSAQTGRSYGGARHAARLQVQTAAPFDGHEDAAVLAAALRRLSPRQRAVVLVTVGRRVMG